MPIDLAIIPVAGQGTRMLPATKSQPKEMLPIGRKPVVQYIVEELVASGIRKLLLITGPGKTAIENHFDINWELIHALRESGKEDLLAELEFERQPNVNYFYTRQRRQLGLGHAVLCAKPLVGQQPFVVALGDSIIGLHAKSQVVQTMIEVFEQRRADAVIAFEEVPEAEVTQYGIAQPAGEIDAVFEVRDLIEKPARAEAPSRLAIAARYVCSPAIFDFLERTEPGKGGEIQFTDAFRLLLKEGGKVLGVCLRPGETRYDIGNFESYFQSFVDFALADPQYGPALTEYVRKRLQG